MTSPLAASWLQLLTIAGFAATAVALGMTYVHATIGRTRHRWLRLLFVAVQLALLTLLGLINVRAADEMQVFAQRQACRDRMSHLAGLLLEAQRLHGDRLPPDLAALVELPRFRHHDILSPLTGSPYRYRRTEDGQAAVLESEVVPPSPWSHEPGGFHRLTLDATTASRAIEWVEVR